jgi:hypothetical protein
LAKAEIREQLWENLKNLCNDFAKIEEYEISNELAEIINNHKDDLDPDFALNQELKHTYNQEARIH